MEGVYADMLRVADRINANGSRDELLARLSKSDSAGERLTAIAMLEDEPHPSYIRWLGTRFDVEAPFVGYHAATAIRAAVEVLDDPAAQDALQKAIRNAFRVLGPDRASTDRAAVLLDAQSRLSSTRRARRR
jgi:hypothetical protein